MSEYEQYLRNYSTTDVMKYVQQLIPDENLMEKDYEEVKRMYPQKLKFLNLYIEDALDQLEYTGSPMFAEYLDRYLVYQIADDIYNRYRPQMWNQRPPMVEEERNEREEWNEQGSQMNQDGGLIPPYVPDNPNAKDEMLLWLIEIMIYNEMLYRRNRYQRRRQRFQLFPQVVSNEV